MVMPIKLALVSGSFGRRSLRETIDVAHRHDFHAIELHGKHHSADRLTSYDREDMRLAARAGISFNLHFKHDSTPATGNDRIRDGTRDQFLRDLELLEQVNGKVIVLHPGVVDYEESEVTVKTDLTGERHDAARRFIDFVASVSDEAMAAGVAIAIENQHLLPEEVVVSYSELAAIVDEIDRANVCIALDIGHCIIGDGLEPAIEAFGPRIQHLHVNDAIDGVEHFEVGVGSLNLDEMADLTTDRFDIEYATIEAGFYEEDAEGVALRSREVLRRRFGNVFV